MLLTVALLAAVAHAAVPGDLVTSLPGFGAPPTAWYSGYLSFTGVNNARLHMHYVFQSSPNAATDPVTVWMNGACGAARRCGRRSVPLAFMVSALTFMTRLAHTRHTAHPQAAPAAPAWRA